MPNKGVRACFDPHQRAGLLDSGFLVSLWWGRTVGTRKWTDVAKGSLGPTNDHNYVGTKLRSTTNKYTISQNTGLKVDRRTTLE